MQRSSKGAAKLPATAAAKAARRDARKAAAATVSVTIVRSRGVTTPIHLCSCTRRYEALLYSCSLSNTY